MSWFFSSSVSSGKDWCPSSVRQVFSLLFSLFVLLRFFNQLDNCYLYWGRDCFFFPSTNSNVNLFQKCSRELPTLNSPMTRSLGAQNVWPNISAANSLVKLTHKITITITTTVNALLSLSQLLQYKSSHITSLLVHVFQQSLIAFPVQTHTPSDSTRVPLHFCHRLLQAFFWK